jgi:hypothetical protein
MTLHITTLGGSDKYKTKQNKRNKLPCFIDRLVWPVLLAKQILNPLQNKETQHVNIVLQCMYRFLEEPNMIGNHAWIEW